MKQKIITLLVVCFVTILFAFYLVKDELPLLSKLYEPISWRGIVPGITPIQDIEQLLGTPDKKATYNGFQIYEYEDREDLGWVWVEIWFQDAPASDKIQAVLLSSPYEDQPDGFTLEASIALYGKPNFVTWSSTPYLRYICWSNRGIAANVWIDPTYT